MRINLDEFCQLGRQSHLLYYVYFRNLEDPGVARDLVNQKDVARFSERPGDAAFWEPTLRRDKCTLQTLPSNFNKKNLTMNCIGCNTKKTSIGKYIKLNYI